MPAVDCAKPDDQQIRSVLEALEDPRWDFRTVDGISNETGLVPSVVEAVLDDMSETVRVSPVPDRQGRALYTLKSKPRTINEYLSSIRAFVTKST